MSGGNEFNEAAMWRRWREGAAAGGKTAAKPDALSLAAYAENRLGRPGIDPETDPATAAIEAWLFDHPDALEDIAAARSASEGVASAATIARAAALIARPGANVVTLRQARTWRDTVAWSSIAASLLAAILIGFQLGNDGIVDLSDSQNPAIDQVLIGSPGTILAPDDEDTGI